MAAPFFRVALQQQPYITLALNPVHVPPVILPDGRQFDFYEARIFNGDLHDLNENTIRWKVQIEAHERMACEAYFFCTWVYWSVASHDEFPVFDNDRHPALVTMCAARIAEYLRFHPFPSYGCKHHQTTILEIS